MDKKDFYHPTYSQKEAKIRNEDIDFILTTFKYYHRILTVLLIPEYKTKGMQQAIDDSNAWLRRANLVIPRLERVLENRKARAFAMAIAASKQSPDEKTPNTPEDPQKED